MLVNIHFQKNNGYLFNQVTMAEDQEFIENQVLAKLNLKTRRFWGHVYERNIKNEVPNWQFIVKWWL